MKKSLILGLLGLTISASSAHALGEGIIYIHNYQAPYNAVVWDVSVPQVGGTHVWSTQGVQLELWFGEGILAANQLTNSAPLVWRTSGEALGYAGYYYTGNNEEYPFYEAALLPEWNPGDTYTFQVRASGSTAYGMVDQNLSRSTLWLENDIRPNFRNDVPGFSTESIGLSVSIPEPSDIALACSCLAAVLLFRRSPSLKP
jgi:hypothetical protein